jgi:hypothetical protein
MDIALRLRILVWIVVISLWGMMLYQYLGKSFHFSREIFSQSAAAHHPGKGSIDPDKLASAGVAAGQALAKSEQSTVANSPSSLDLITPIQGAEPATQSVQASHGLGPLREEKISAPPAQIPTGFFLVKSKHFNIYSEGRSPDEEFIAMAENLHGNLMLDLASFSPWAEEGRVSLFLFQNAQTYHLVTGRPEWSGGASSVSERKVYVYKSSELTGILAHELCHIYYDGFYLDGHPDPLWLSEGMATMIQVERGFARPEWLRENLKVIEHGGGYSLHDLMAVATMGNAPPAKIQLWYAQSYSLVHYLVREHYPTTFYRFSKYIRTGDPVKLSLYQAYGMPFNSIRALQYAWRANVSGKRPSLSVN